MSSDFIEVHEMWRLCVGRTQDYSSPLSDSIWIHLQLSATIRNIVEELGGKIYVNVGYIIFSHPGDILVFRLRAGV